MKGLLIANTFYYEWHKRIWRRISKKNEASLAMSKIRKAFVKAKCKVYVKCTHNDGQGIMVNYLNGSK